MSVRRIVLAAAVCVVAAGPVGCSGGTALEDGSAEEVAARAAEAMRAAESLRITGRVTTGGVRTDVDVALARNGECAGSVTADGGTAEVVGTGDETYVRGDERFWRRVSGDRPGAGALVRLLGNRWVKADPRSPGGGPGGFCDLDGLLGRMGTGNAGGITRGEVRELDGREVIPLFTEWAGGTTTVYVANDDAGPRILRMESEGGDEPGVMDFTGYDEAVEVREPDPDEVVEPDGAFQRGP